MPKRILVVDNELRSRELIAHFLREADYEVWEAADGVSAIAMLDERSFDLMICDVVMPQLGAFDVIGHIESRLLSTAVILITGHPDLLSFSGFGQLVYFSKPFNMYDLLQKVRTMTDH